MLKKIKYGFNRTLLKTIGRCSKGMRLCLSHGLTSGKTLDYIYENNPQGNFFIGKYIDRKFLGHPGWEGVRWRRKHLETLLSEAIGELKASGNAVSLVDIASGPGSYILSVFSEVGEENITACCKDIDERWLQEGRDKAQIKNLKNVRFEKGDAFDRNSLASINPKPNIIVSSGFYDWITDDDKVKESIDMVYQTLSDGGYMIVTNQTAHPDLEYVQEVFRDFNNNPLRMSMRSKETVQQWLDKAGFTVLATCQDPHGYYSVTKAKKREP